jgi:hypothetical protein
MSGLFELIRVRWNKFRECIFNLNQLEIGRVTVFGICVINQNEIRDCIGLKAIKKNYVEFFIFIYLDRFSRPGYKYIERKMNNFLILKV